MKDVIYNTTEIKFSFADRLKLLIGGKSVSNITIETENEIVHVKQTTAKTRVQYPDWINRIRFRKKTGYGEPIMSAGEGI
jgi:hypothetical protein